MSAGQRHWLFQICLLPRDRDRFCSHKRVNKAQERFPPFSQIPFCLSKLIKEEAEEILVTPYWPSQPCFPTIMDLAVAVPLLLRTSPDLLTSPLGESHHPLVQDDCIRLIAWRWSGSAFLRAKFQRKLHPSCSPQHEKIQTLHIRPLGIFAEIGVLRGKRIPCLLAARDKVNFLTEYMGKGATDR